MLATLWLLLATAPTVEGVLERDPAHPHALMRRGGTHVFLCGPGDPEDFLYRGRRRSDGTRNGDQEVIIRKLIEHGGNTLYIQAIRSHGGDGAADHNPFVDSVPSNGLDEDILAQWERWFSLMDDNEIVIYLFLFDDGAQPWGAPSDEASPPEERAFVRAMVERFKHHRNLVWVVGEEANEAYTVARIHDIARTIAKADGRRHLIGSHHHSRTDFPSWAPGVPLDHYSMQYNVHAPSGAHEGAVEARRLAEQADDGYLVVYAENTKVDCNDLAACADFLWAVAMAGVMPLTLGVDVVRTPPALLAVMRHLQRFFEATDHAGMRSQDGLRSDGTDYVLAEPGQSYIAYQQRAGRPLGIKDVDGGRYKLLWLDVMSGSRVEQEVAVRAGTARFRPPAGIGVPRALWVSRVANGVDERGGVIQFAIPEYEVPEGAGVQRVLVTRTGGASGAASVRYRILGASARPGLDYEVLDGALSWSDGDSQPKAVMLKLRDDSLVERQEQIRMVLHGARGGRLGQQRITTVWLRDDDGGNGPPVAHSDAIRMAGGSVRRIILRHTDRDGPGPYRFQIVTPPLHGTLTGANNDHSYTPAAGFVGRDRFTFQVSDGKSMSTPATVTITVVRAEAPTSTAVP